MFGGLTTKFVHRWTQGQSKREISISWACSSTDFVPGLDILISYPTGNVWTIKLKVKGLVGGETLELGLGLGLTTTFISFLLFKLCVGIATIKISLWSFTNRRIIMQQPRTRKHKLCNGSIKWHIRGYWQENWAVGVYIFVSPHMGKLYLNGVASTSREKLSFLCDVSIKFHDSFILSSLSHLIFLW